MNPLPNYENTDNFNMWSEVVEQSVDSIVITDTNYSITDLNEAAEQMFGWSLEELKGKKPYCSKGYNLNFKNMIFLKISMKKLIYKISN
ncbi:PAS domain S-box protein [Methanohalophilus euhalobius]|jgi:nitrogen-specific signal transduction histidine kinase|nr:PAS domain S-box protein [Methanohalophilus euhalobius]PQV43201.1 PAS domain S-box-containing protein [Methanohalophilus euhalobius]